MISDFLLLKLNRAIWIALLDEEKILDAISYFESYIADVSLLLKNKKYKQEAQEELDFSKGVITVKLLNLADRYFGESDYTKALYCYTELFKLGHRSVSVLENYIACLGTFDVFDVQTELLEYLQSECKNDVKINKMFAQVYDKQGKMEKAVEYMEKYIQYSGNNVSALDYNLQGCYCNKVYDRGNRDNKYLLTAIKYFIKASEKDTTSKLFQKNVTIVAGKAHEYEICKKYWQKVIESGQMTNDDKYDYAAFCLLNTDFEGWYKYFDARFKKEHDATPFPKYLFEKCKMWDGSQDISKSTLLVHCEQGFGDTFLMWGYMPRLTKIAKKVIFVAQQPVYTLLYKNDFGVEVLCENENNLEDIDFDYFIPSMSIPVVLKLNRENISVGSGYIKSNSDRTNLFKDLYFNNDKFKIGIAFKGNPKGDKTRDIPINDLFILDKLKNVKFYCLSKDVSNEALSGFKNNEIMNIANDLNNFEDTASVMDNLDLIICSDNGIMNLAGAMGKKTIALFNWCYYYRWFGIKDGKTVWYDDCIKPFINDRMDNWESSISQAIEEIKKIQKTKN